MHRFFVNPENITENRILITGDDVNHTRSLRLKIGEKITICNTQGVDYLVEITELNKDEVACKVIESGPSQGEPELQVTLLQGLPKSDKLDLIVQKCTELGIGQIIPVETARSIVKLNDKKADRRIERWQKIAEEAAKQSARGRVPVVGQVQSWKECLAFIKKEAFDLLFVPWEGAKDQSIRQVLKQFQESQSPSKRGKPLKIAYLVGPEGGLSEEEVQTFMENGATPVTLGPRILRTETAGFTVLTILMYEFLEMEGCDRR